MILVLGRGDDMDSVLTSIKKLLGIEETDTNFDIDIMIYINGALMSLNQLGVGPETGFTITDKTVEWADFIGDRIDIELVKSYVYLKVRMIFDPPANSFVIDAMKTQAAELEWRINIQIENAAYIPEVVVEEEV